MKNFDPNAAAPQDSGIFGLPFSVEQAQLILIPVPWEVTTSYGGGTSQGPRAIFQASKQVDLYDWELGNFFEAGIAMLDEASEVQQWNQLGRQAAQAVIDAGGVQNDAIAEAVKTVNEYSEKLNHYVYSQTK